MAALRDLFVEPERLDHPVRWRTKMVSSLAAFLFVTVLFTFSFSHLTYHWNWAGIVAYRQKFLNGWFATIGISLASLALSTFIGLFFALVRRTRFLPLRYLGNIYVELVRGTPLLVQILIFWYVVADAFGVGNRYLVGVLTLSFFAGAYISEIIRAGIESISQSQLESAKAIGLTQTQTYRYVVFPQSLRQTLPPLAGQFVSLIKDSSLLSIIAISEFTLNAQEVNAFTYSSLESYIPLALGYLVLTLPLSLWIRRLEKRAAFET